LSWTDCNRFVVDGDGEAERLNGVGEGLESRLGESGRNDKWLFCLTASMIGAHQERL
jgi:hypothetical protein